MNEQRIPLLSVGLLVHNGEAYLSETLDSILAQMFDDFELIVSDNASTDGTEKICRAYLGRDSRIRYVRQAENIGAIGNFNFLVSQARGRYFKWAAADDLIAPTFLGRCIETLESRPEFVLCHSRTVTIGGDGEELPNDIIRSCGAAENPDLPRTKAYRPWQRFRDVMLGNTAVMDLWGVIRTNALLDTGLWQPFLGYEKILMANLSLRGRFAELPAALFEYRIHPKQISSQSSATERQGLSGSFEKAGSYARIQYLKGYVLGISRSGLPFVDRLLCYFSVTRYLFQLKKWKHVVRDILHGAKFDEGNNEIQRRNAGSAEARQQRQNSGGFRI